MRIRPPYLIIALLAFALRALIPVGFMPAADGTISLMICPGGFPPELLPPAKAMSDGMGAPKPTSRHGHGLREDGFCAFTTGFSSAPPPLIVAALYLLLAVITSTLTSMSAPAGIRLVHTPQARAPPANS
jgi:hypothetical protein